MSTFNYGDMARGYGSQSYEDLMNYYSGRYTYESEPQPKTQPKQQPAPHTSNPIPTIDYKSQVLQYNDHSPWSFDTFEHSEQPAPSTPVTSNHFTDENGFEWRSIEEYEAAQGQPAPTGGPAPKKEIEYDPSRVGGLGGLTGEEPEQEVPPANPQEIAELQAKVTKLEGEIKTATQNCATAREGYINALKEKTAAKKAFEDAIEKCRKEKLTFEAVQKELQTNPNPSEVIAKYRDAMYRYNKSCTELNKAGSYYRSMNNTLITKLRDLSTAQTALKSAQGESEALSKAIKRTESRIKIKTKANDGIDKVMNEKEFDPKEFFEKAGEKAEKRLKSGKWVKRFTLWGGVGVGVAAAVALILLLNNDSKAETTKSATTSTTLTVPENESEVISEETISEVTEEEIEDENRIIQEGIDRYKYNPKAAFKVEKGDCLWNAVRAILKNKNGVEPTDAQIQRGVRAFVYENGFEFTDNDGIKGYRPGLEVNQVDLDSEEYQNLVRVGNKVVKRQ